MYWSFLILGYIQWKLIYFNCLPILFCGPWWCISICRPNEAMAYLELIVAPYILIERLMQTNYYLNDILAITFLSYRFSLFLLLLCDSIESRALAFFQQFFVLFLFRHLHNFFSISCTLCALFYSPLLLVAHCLRIVAVNIIIFFACCFSIYCYLEHCSKSIGTIICTRFAVVSAWNPWTT